MSLWFALCPTGRVSRVEPWPNKIALKNWLALGHRCEFTPAAHVVFSVEPPARSIVHVEAPSGPTERAGDRP